MTDGRHNARAGTPPLAALVALCFALGVLNAAYNPWLLERSAALFWAIDLASFVLVPALGLALLRRRWRFDWRELGFPPAGDMAGLLRLLALSLVVAAAFAATLALTGALGGERLMRWLERAPAIGDALGGGFSYAEAIPEAGWPRAVVIAYLSLSAGFMEELVYRALLLALCLRSLPPRAQRPGYVLGGACAFSLVHFEQGPAVLAGTLALGVVAALLYLRIRAVLPFMAGHALVDLFEFG